MSQIIKAKIAIDRKKVLNLESDIHKILANDICSCQSLDKKDDRSRVAMELLTMLYDKYNITLKQ